MSASFQTDQDGINHQDAMPAAPPPDGLPGLQSFKVFDDAGFKQFEEWDVRIVPREQLQLLPGKASQQQVWFRHRDPLPDDPVLHICALAYMSDLTLLGSAQVNHLEEREHLQIASLDHAMWFMRTFRADEWLLYDQSSPSACGGRALTQGKIFNQYGEMVAAVMQEGLTRYKREYQPPVSAPRGSGSWRCRATPASTSRRCAKPAPNRCRCAAAVSSTRWTRWSFPVGSRPR